MKGTACRRSLGRLPASSITGTGSVAGGTLTGGTPPRGGDPVAILIALVVVLLLGLFMRWAFGTGYGRERPRPTPVDDGLLTKIATLSKRESALALRAVLSDAGIRSTLRYPAADRTVLLVFPEDAPRARELAATFTPGSD